MTLNPAEPRTFFHASCVDIAAPDKAAWRAANNWMGNGNCVLGLFSTSTGQGLHVYGDKLFSFRLKSAARVLDVPHDFIQGPGCNQLFFGIRLLAEHQGFDALRVNHDDEQAHLVVMNFDVIADWARAEFPD